MTDLDRLIEAVEAGAIPVLSASSFRAINSGIGVYVDHRASDALHAYNGSLDAALALHEALLPPQMCPLIDAILRPSGNVEWRAIIHEQGVLFPQKPRTELIVCGFDVVWNNPARAWLLAILKAYRETLTIQETQIARRLT